MTTSSPNTQITQQAKSGPNWLLVILVILAALVVVFLAFLLGAAVGGGSSGEEPVTNPGPDVQYLTPPIPSAGSPALTTTAALNVRQGPGTEFASYGLLAQGYTVGAVGIIEEGTWYTINFPQGEVGMAWVSADYVIPQNVEGLPVLTP